jgi:hypothetical protein
VTDAEVADAPVSGAGARKVDPPAILDLKFIIIYFK